MKTNKPHNNKMLVLPAAVAILVLLFLTLPLKACAMEHEDLFALGNQACAAGKYNEAIAHYKKVMETGGVSASLFYNMANAYYQKKDAGQTILNYERALFLDPRDVDVRANLRMAQKDFGLIAEPVPVWQKFLNITNMNKWAWIASAAFALFGFLFLINGIRPVLIPPAPFRVIAGTILVLFAVSTAALVLQYRNLDLGVVTGDSARLRVSPFDAASSPTDIKTGTVVRMTKKYGDYVFIEEPKGKSGWADKNAVEAIAAR